MLLLKYCAETCLQNEIKRCESRKNFDKLWQINEINASFSCFAFISPKFEQILKYLAQSCDCMIAAFRNSDYKFFYISMFGCVLDRLYIQPTRIYNPPEEGVSVQLWSGNTFWPFLEPRMVCCSSCKNWKWVFLSPYSMPKATCLTMINSSNSFALYCYVDYFHAQLSDNNCF